MDREGEVCSPLTAHGVGQEISLLSISTFSSLVFPRIQEIPKVAVWHTGPGSAGQHQGDAPSEQGRRDQIQEPGHEGPEYYLVLSEVEGLSDCGPYFDNVCSWFWQITSPLVKILVDQSTPHNGLWTPG